MGDAVSRVCLPTRPFPALDHDVVDEANLLNCWLYRNAGNPAILLLDPPSSAPDWPSVVKRALALRDEELVFDVRSAELDDGDAGPIAE